MKIERIDGLYRCSFEDRVYWGSDRSRVMGMVFALLEDREWDAKRARET